MGSTPKDTSGPGMRTNKKLSSMALVFVLVMSSMTVPFVSFVIDEANSFTAAPFTTTTEEGAWDIHGNEMTILYYCDTSENIAFVTGIEGGSAGLKILNLPEEVEHNGKKFAVVEIDRYAFSDCVSVTTVNMPAVTHIGKEAFYNCASLTTINMPNVTEIDEDVFSGCTSLVGFQDFDEDNDTFKTIDGVIHSKDGTTLVIFPAGKGGVYTTGDDVTTISESAFRLNEKITEIVMPNVTTMESGAFWTCKSLTSVSMPNVTSIGGDVFSYCAKLTKFNAFDDTNTSYKTIDGVIHSADGTELVVFPAGRGGEYTVDKDVRTIKDVAFNGCNLLEAINMPYVTKIGNAAFHGCYSLTEFKEFSRNNAVYKTIDGVIHSADGTELVVFPAGRGGEYVVDENVETIARDAFTGCRFIEAVDLSNVTTIGEEAFWGCASLKTIDTSKVTTINPGTFYNCTALTTVNMPNVTTIGEEAFENCTSLTTINMPNVTTIGNYGFYNCNSLTTVSIPKATSIGNRVFQYCVSLTTIDMPKLTTMGTGAFYNCSALTTIDLPAVESIGDNAFRNCASLASISMPKIASIGELVFAYCAALATVNMPNVTTIGNYAFYGCKPLTGFQDFDEDNPSLRTIDGVIHSEDGSVLVLFPPGRNGEYTVGEEVDLIPSGAFSSGVSLNILSIPLKTEVEAHVFLYSDITTLVIYTEGTGTGNVLDSIMGEWGGYLPGASDTLETVIVDCDASSSDFNGSTHADGVVLAFTENAKISETDIATYFENAFTMDDLQGNAYLWNEEGSIWKQCSTDDEYEVFLKYDEKMGDVDRPVYLDQLLGLQELTFRALPNEGYEFVRWSNGSTDERLDIWVYDTTTVEAIFAPATASKNVDAPLTYDDIKKDLESAYSTFTYVVDIDDLDCLVRLTPDALFRLLDGRTLIVSVTENGKEICSWTFDNGFYGGVNHFPGAGLDLQVSGDVSQEIKDKAEEVNDRGADIVYINTQQNEPTMERSTLSYNIGKSGTFALFTYDEYLGKFVDTGETVTADGGYVTITLDNARIYALMTETQEGGGDSDDDLLLYGAIAAVAIVALLGIILAWRRFKK